jgi:molybdenum cofactor guanylyltransferase
MYLSQIINLSASPKDSMGSLTGALLAGGRSVRMGQDKAFLVYAGEPLWKRQLGTLYKAGLAPLLMACRMEQKLAESVKSWAIDHGTDVMMVFDPEEESISERGPLAALVRCLKRAPGAILTLAVDMPLVSAEFLAKLRIAWGEGEGGWLCSGKV